jgi:hypothetical protein
MFAKLPLRPLPPGTAINSHRDNCCLPSFSLYLLLSLLQAEALPVSTGGVELFAKQPGLLLLFLFAGGNHISVDAGGVENYYTFCVPDKLVEDGSDKGIMPSTGWL